MNLVNATNNKKFEVPVDIYFYSPQGKEYDFVARNVGLRIQGTSSTTYPRKNYRLYFLRLEKYGTTLEVNGVDVPSLEYSFKLIEQGYKVIRYPISGYWLDIGQHDELARA